MNDDFQFLIRFLKKLNKLNIILIWKKLMMIEISISSEDWEEIFFKQLELYEFDAKGLEPSKFGAKGLKYFIDYI